MGRFWGEYIATETIIMTAEIEKAARKFPVVFTPTSRIIQRMQLERNPVTRAVFREIVGNRIDRALENCRNGKVGGE